MRTLLSFVFPQTVYRSSSRFNRDIRVNMESGRYKLLVEGSRQSGKYIEYLWKDVFRFFKIRKLSNISHILVLGVGGGNVIYLVKKYFPDASIDAVDIDPEIVLIGKKYFHLDSLTNTVFYIQDAKQFVTKMVKKHASYDLIIVDVFIGRHVPEFVTSDTFLSEVKHLLSPQGALLINYLRELEYKTLSEYFFQKLKRLFPSVGSREIKLNRFFFSG